VVTPQELIEYFRNEATDVTGRLSSAPGAREAYEAANLIETLMKRHYVPKYSHTGFGGQDPGPGYVRCHHRSDSGDPCRYVNFEEAFYCRACGKQLKKAEGQR
jgi:hypothetical protein